MTSDYKVVLSPSCTDDIESIFEYIAFCLLEPKLAKDIIEEIKNRLVSLSYMPYRFRLFSAIGMNRSFAKRMLRWKKALVI